MGSCSGRRTRLLAATADVDLDEAHNDDLVPVKIIVGSSPLTFGC